MRREGGRPGEGSEGSEEGKKKVVRKERREVSKREGRREEKRRGEGERSE